MKKKSFFKWLIILIVLILAGALIKSCSLYWATDKTINQNLSKIDQNALHYVTQGSRLIVSKEIQDKESANYLQNYFSVWDIKSVRLSLEKTQELENETAEAFTKNPGWGRNRNLNSLEWIENIIDNMNLSQLGHSLKRAITLRDTEVRVLPTEDPSFENWKKAGEGYPFDYIQYTHIYANTPIVILNTSKDHLWHLIQTGNYIGWIRNNSAALVSSTFINRWKTGRYIVVKKNFIPGINHDQNYAVKTHMGVLYPLIKEEKSDYLVLSTLPITKSTSTIPIKLSKDDAALFPLPLTEKNIATVVNNLIGDPYSWGSFEGYEDCSSTLMNIFSLFGVILAPNSKLEIMSTEWKSLTNLTAEEKKHFILKNGIPFFTLLYRPGHIVLYIGEKEGKLYALQTMWGLRTRNLFGKEGRAIVGKTVITPLSFGYQNINITKTLLDGLDKMGVLVPPQ